MEIAVFGGGCFWCTEAVFKMLRGVTAVEPGYAGSPRAEVIRLEYDPSLVKYTDLLTVFFGSHDPTSVNQQGADIGTQYRSIILTTSSEQGRQAREFIDELNRSSKFGKKIVTDVEPLVHYSVAEDYHKDYYAKNKDAMYCQIVINPKLEKVQKDFAKLLK
jgi:peptide-methionine (S)-S-oxide reductase